MSKKKKWKNKFLSRPFYSKLVIPIDIFQKITALTFEAEGEISGFGKTKIIEDGLSITGSVVKVTQLEIFNQECNPAHTTLKNEDLHQMYYNVAKDGGDPSQWNFWWHSHVKMDTGFSGEDDNTMTKISSKGGMVVALCTNKYGDYDATIYKDGKKLMNRLELMVLPEISSEVLEDARKIIKEKVVYQGFPSFNKKTINYDTKYGSRVITYYEDDFDNSDIPAGYPPIVGMSKEDKEKLNSFKEQNNIPTRERGWNVRP